MQEVEAVGSLFQIATQVEKIGIISILFFICIVLAWLLRKSVSDKQEVTRLLDSHKEDMNRVLSADREDRKKLYDKMVEGITKSNQSIDEIKNLVKQQQEFSSSLIKVIIDRGK